MKTSTRRKLTIIIVSTVLTVLIVGLAVMLHRDSKKITHTTKAKIVKQSKSTKEQPRIYMGSKEGAPDWAK